MAENNPIDNRNVNDRERRANTHNHSPEEESVLAQRAEHRERTGVFFRVHVEEAAGEVLGLPGHEAEEDGEDAVGGGAGAEGQVARRVVAVVAVGAEVAVAVGVEDDDETDEAQRAHARAVDEFVDDEFAGENASAQGVGWAGHYV